MLGKCECECGSGQYIVAVVSAVTSQQESPGSVPFYVVVSHFGFSPDTVVSSHCPKIANRFVPVIRKQHTSTLDCRSIN